MDSHDGATEDGGKGRATESNVVRLPRDWLGPREELIPFGPRAREAERARRLSHEPTREEWPEQAAPPQRESASPLAPSPSDFWGEYSADMHHALQGPKRASEAASERPAFDHKPDPAVPQPRDDAPNLDTAPVHAADVGEPDLADARNQAGTLPPPARRRTSAPWRREARSGRGVRWRRWAERPASGHARVRQHRRLGSRSWRVLAATMLGGLGVAVVAVLAGVFATGGALPARETAQLRLPARVLQELSARRIRFPDQLADRPAAHRVVHRGTQAHHHRARARVSNAVSVSAPVSAGSSPSSGSTASGSNVSSLVSSSGTAGGASAGSGSGSASGSGATGSDSGSGSGSGSSSGAGSRSSGPVGPGAPFGPGHLG